jgi:hypothetical protein
MNYTELRTAVQDYCENTFTDTDFATMTKLAEQKIYNSVQLPLSRKTVTSALTIGSVYLATPTDFLSAFSLAVVDSTGAYSYLLDKDVNFIREAYPNPSTTGTPKHYAIFGPDSGAPLELTFIVGPTPSAALATELNYFAYPTSIVTNSTSWIGDNFDSVLFNAIMVEAIRFMKGEPDLVIMYDEAYKQSLILFKNLVDGKMRQDTYRNGQARNEVI